MLELFIMVSPEGVSLFACRESEIARENLPPGTKVYRIGFADPSLIPPGRTLMAGELTAIFTANVKPFIVIS